MVNYNYVYKIKDLLPKELELNNEYDNIYLGIYQVNKEGKYPFLKYLLSRNENGLLSFPKLPKYTSFNVRNIMPYSEVYISGILQPSKFEELKKNIVFDGYYEYNSNLYLFFDITNCESNIEETHMSSNFRFGIIDEIVNRMKICDIEIDSNMALFFMKNEDFLYLYNEDNIQYEVPMVGYVGKSTEQKVNFVMTFGESAKNKSAMFGPYFYFTNFNKALYNGCWSNGGKQEFLYGNKITDEFGRYKKGGVVRFALFMGKTKYVENSPNDPNDESDIKKQRLKDTTLDYKKEILTLRMSDHDGLWTKSFDSVYLSNIELDDGTYLDDTPLIVLKEYSQQIPLSSHFIIKPLSDQQNGIKLV